jgi:ectoine hydroxylase
MHLVDPFFAALSRHPTMLGVARQVLRGEIYVHQSKVNAKLAKRGDRWEWHQDYVFWQAEDGMELPNAVNVALYLTDATEENGALNLIAGSHAFGVISPIVAEEKPAGYESMPAWITNLTARLKYTVAQGDIDTLLVHERAVSATAKAASLLLFHPNLVHSSGENTSEEDRLLLMYSYNRCDNAPVLRGSARPDFLCNPASDSLSELSLGDWNDILSAEEVSRTA